ncbi:hypothetical protein KUH03_05500 [Sphingobacterium sp. E70]|uniref:hypothetical protein n=1 Tax=Sphingobacterium sp. E70 TaxID=2853439 RepID=UPI00211CB1D5|nr:hypothetical protein [Sphingobacterium sp. E70]ULT26363.1 hypothetical protein KUH03_05500 [Sphingobacterium sp. E70]
MLAELVKSEPAYFRVKDPEMNVSDWIAPILNQFVEEFGACLIIEAWTASPGQQEDIQIHIARKMYNPLHNILESNWKRRNLLQKSKL